MNATVIRTERLCLRKAVEADLDAFYAMMSDPETMRYWSTLPHASRDVTRTWLASKIAAQAGIDNDDFVVELDGKAIGQCGASRLPELGYLIARPHWGKGYASEALAAYIRHAFSNGADHLTADIDPNNRRSRALMKRAGFVETGFAERAFLIGEVWCDSVYYRLDRDQAA